MQAKYSQNSFVKHRLSDTEFFAIIRVKFTFATITHTTGLQAVNNFLPADNFKTILETATGC